jgi:hypothetical protein
VRRLLPAGLILGKTYAAQNVGSAGRLIRPARVASRFDPIFHGMHFHYPMSLELRSITRQQNISASHREGIHRSDGHHLVILQIGRHAGAFGAKPHRRALAQKFLRQFTEQARITPR